jgi:hypothetical protein
VRVLDFSSTDEVMSTAAGPPPARPCLGGWAAEGGGGCGNASWEPLKEGLNSFINVIYGI